MSIPADPCKLLPARFVPPIRRGVTPGPYSCADGCSATYDGALVQQARAVHAMVHGTRCGSYLPPEPGCLFSYTRALACALPCDWHRL